MCGVLVARVPGQRPTPTFARVYLFADFVISSPPMPSSRLGPTNKYDGDAHMRKSFAGALQRGAALRLFPFASSFAVQKRIVFALVTIFMSQGSRGRHIRLGILAAFPRCRPLVRPIPPLAPGIVTCVLISSLSGRDPRQVEEETFADPDTLPSKQLRQSVYFAPVSSDILRGAAACLDHRRSLPIQIQEPVPRVQVLFRVVSQVPVSLPKLSHLFSADCLLRDQFAS